MRKTAPKLVLQGDTVLAKKWISWATKALERIKNLTVTGMANKVLRPVTGVAVHVWSVNNIDRIRIAVQAIKKCWVKFTASITSGSAPLYITTVPKFSDDIHQSLFLSGDREVRSTGVYTYEESGIYSPTYKAWANKGLSLTISPEIINRVYYYKDPGFYDSYAEAYSQFISFGWTIVDGSLYEINYPPGSFFTNSDWIVRYMASSGLFDVGGVPTQLWRVRAVKEVFTIKFSDLETGRKYISVFSARDGGTFDPISTDNYDSGAGLISGGNSLGLRRFRGASPGGKEIAEVTSIALTDLNGVYIDTEVELVDGNNYDQLKDPIGGATGWHLDWFGTDPTHERPSVKSYPYTCLAINQKIDYITVT